jgi:hypothetical protein
MLPAVGDYHIDILARVTAALNTDLEGAIAELDRCHEELQNAQARIAQLEAQLAGQQSPEEAMSYSPTDSPPRKRLRYNTPEATIRLGYDLRMPTFIFYVSIERSCEDDRCNNGYYLNTCLIWIFACVSCMVERWPQCNQKILS